MSKNQVITHADHEGHRSPAPHFEPSSWHLEQQIAGAMAKFEESRDQSAPEVVSSRRVGGTLIGKSADRAERYSAAYLKGCIGRGVRLTVGGQSVELDHDAASSLLNLLTTVTEQPWKLEG